MASTMYGGATPTLSVTSEGWTQKLPPLTGSRSNWNAGGNKAAWQPKLSVGAGEGVSITSRSPRALALDLYNAANIGLAKGLPGRAREKPVEEQLRRELWEAHKDIARNVKMLVPPYPFAGQPMRFQDDVAALQIFADGRFSLVLIGNAVQVFEKAFPMDEQPSPLRRLLSFEGACGTLLEASAALVDASKQAGVGAMAEGRAIVKAEVRIESGRPKLIDVVREDFRFELLLAPAHCPTQIIVRPVSDSKSAPVPKWKRWSLPYVDKGPLDADAQWHPRRVEAQSRIDRRKDRISPEKKIQKLQIQADMRRQLPPITPRSQQSAMQADAGDLKVTAANIE